MDYLDLYWALWGIEFYNVYSLCSRAYRGHSGMQRVLSLNFWFKTVDQPTIVEEYHTAAAPFILQVVLAIVLARCIIKRKKGLRTWKHRNIQLSLNLRMWKLQLELRIKDWAVSLSMHLDICHAKRWCYFHGSLSRPRSPSRKGWFHMIEASS